MLCCFSLEANPTISERDIKVLELLGTLVGQRIARLREEDQRLGPLRKEIWALIQSRKFRTVFQPIIHIKTQLTSGYEALTRFESGLPPDEVFKTAAQAQLQPSLETAVVKSAISHLPRLQEGRYLSVNISATTVADPEFQATILSARPEQIVLELTEHDAIENYQHLIEALAPLRAAGVRLAVDDVGSGYASFQHILSLFPDMIKLDRSLVEGLTESKTKRAIVAAMVGFARETETTLVAEGIETDHEREVVLQLGAEFGQGYLFGRPTDAIT
jgi:EAL domain-containing protein (putative c-di-GMP-specific phosphodiesterase class I)